MPQPLQYPKKYAPVMPIRLAKLWKPGQLGNYHLLLAHDVLKHPVEYAGLYGNITSLKDGIVIMDNSVIELGRPLSMQEMEEAVSITRANVITLPDELLDKDATIRGIGKALDGWEFLHSSQLPLHRMVLPQGSTFDEWVDCLEILMRDYEDQFQWIGIPKNIRLKLGKSRREALDIVETIAPDKEVHLFGFSRDLKDDILSARYGIQVRGIDSAVPIRLGTRDGKPITLGTYVHSERGDWWEDPNPSGSYGMVKQGILNAMRVRQWLLA